MSSSLSTWGGVKPSEDYTWDGTTKDQSWYNEAPEATSYALSKPEEFAGLATLVRGGESFSGKTIILTHDIDLDGYDWTTIGTGNRDTMQDEGDNTGSFQGTFDGGNHVISGLTIDVVTGNADDGTGVGFFGTTNDATIKNIIFENANVSADTNTVGIAVGYAQNTSIENVVIRNSSVSGAEGTGAIAGRVYLTEPGTYTIAGNKSIGNEVHAVSSYNAGGLIGAINNANNNATITVSKNLVDMSNGGFVRAYTENVGGMIGNTAKRGNDAYQGNRIIIADTDNQIVIDRATDKGRQLMGILYGNGSSYVTEEDGNTALIEGNEITITAQRVNNVYTGNNWLAGSAEETGKPVDNTYPTT